MIRPPPPKKYAGQLPTEKSLSGYFVKSSDDAPNMVCIPKARSIAKPRLTCIYVMFSVRVTYSLV